MRCEDKSRREVEKLLGKQLTEKVVFSGPVFWSVSMLYKIKTSDKVWNIMSAGKDV